MSDVQTRVTQIEGVSIKSTSRGDLFVVKAGGTEYSTFASAMGNQARQLTGQTVALRFVEKNVEKDGRSYTNRYYEGAEPYSTGDFGNNSAGLTQLPIPFTGSPAPSEPDRQLKIMRQTATKVAAHLMPYLPEGERTPMGLLAMADFLVLYYEHGNGPNAPADPGPQPGQQGSFYDTQPSPDNDIPF